MFARRSRAFCTRAVVGAVVMLAASSARASIAGEQEAENEGAGNRRGFYLGGGVSFGGQFLANEGFVPGFAASVQVGGGASRRLLVGGNVAVLRYFAPHQSLEFTGDLEFTGFVWRGLYLRGAVGLAALPVGGLLTAGIGGAGGLGYELWVSPSAAMSLGATYDVRAVPSDPVVARQSVLLGIRFTWY